MSKLFSNWAETPLPDSWPDQLQMKRVQDIRYLLKRFFSPRQKVSLPKALTDSFSYPSYLLEEFHHLPNGNYSKGLTYQYISGFDWAMLGTMRKIRYRMASFLKKCSSVLDIGCAGGKLAGQVQMLGVPEVWGLDPSPYLLKHAAHRYPKVRFAQGLIEDLPFSEEYFEGMGCCFLFHELPSKIADQGFSECSRVLKRHGYLVIVEPSPEQLEERHFWALYRIGGFAGWYFSFLARYVYEPFVREWHQQARTLEPWLKEKGFSLKEDRTYFPFRWIVAQKD